MNWRVTKLTEGTPQNRFYAHSYYDIPVFSADERLIAAYETRFQRRMPGPEDVVRVGVVSRDAPGRFEAFGESCAWSWQQGPQAQFVPGTAQMIYNDREGVRFVARRTDGQETETFPLPVYALSPDGGTALSLDMGRLQRLRPGYGYAGGTDDGPLERRPKDSGIRRMDLRTGDQSLILSVDAAVRFLLSRLPLPRRARLALSRNVFWFNHAKFSPGGTRFTVKLRWRVPGKHWDDRQGVSLTMKPDGSALALLADATSHVIFEDEQTLFLYRRGEVVRYADAVPEGRRVGPIAPALLDDNVHMRPMPGRQGCYVYDTPYRTEIELRLLDEAAGTGEFLARFTGHEPPKGPYRCDLHPVPAPKGDAVVVTSIKDGGRQIYLVEPKR